MISSFSTSKNFILTLAIFLSFFIFFFAAPWARADVVSDCVGANCGLNDLTQTMINIAKWILGITGSLALLMFIYGGVVLLISAGNQDRVAQGKQVLTNAIIGLVAVFAAYLIIGFALSLLGIEGQGWATGNLPI